MSPNERETDNLPGRIRNGPGIVEPFFDFIID